MKQFKLATILLVLFLSGCGEPIETAILGSWTGNSPPQDLEFSVDGTVVLKDRKLNRTYKGNYFLNGSRLKMEFTAFNRPVIRDADVGGDELILSRDSGPDETFRRR